MTLDTATTQFTEFPKIARLFRDIVITEKIDGTNAQIVIDEDSNITAGSRNRFITPEADNFGFARWVRDNAEQLRQLGPGTHYGEWWGQGIQRRYGLTEKRFSLFNVARWTDDVRPACCHVVPTLYCGEFDTGTIKTVMCELELHGSFAAPGFMNPEGIIVWHEKARQMFKYTIGDDGHKGEAFQKNNN